MFKAILKGLFGKAEKGLIKSNPSAIIDGEIEIMIGNLGKIQAQIFNIKKSKTQMEYKLKELETKHSATVKNIKLAKQSDSDIAKKMIVDLATVIHGLEEQINVIKESIVEIEENYQDGIKAYNEHKTAIDNARSQKALILSKIEIAKLKSEAVKTKVKFDGTKFRLNGLEKIEEIANEINIETHSLKEVNKDLKSDYDTFEEELNQKSKASELEDIISRY